VIDSVAIIEVQDDEVQDDEVQGDAVQGAAVQGAAVKTAAGIPLIVRLEPGKLGYEACRTQKNQFRFKGVTGRTCVQS
jgi:hypothetical protein